MDTKLRLKPGPKDGGCQAIELDVGQHPVTGDQLIYLTAVNQVGLKVTLALDEANRERLASFLSTAPAPRMEGPEPAWRPGEDSNLRPSV